MERRAYDEEPDDSEDNESSEEEEDVEDSEDLEDLITNAEMMSDDCLEIPENTRWIGQWVSEVVEVTSGESTAEYMIGNHLGYHWTTDLIDKGHEHVIVAFAKPVQPRSVKVYEAYWGALVGISICNIDTNEWVELWRGTPDPSLEEEEETRCRIPTLNNTDIMTRMHCFYEIFAIQLIGDPLPTPRSL